MSCPVCLAISLNLFGVRMILMEKMAKLLLRLRALGAVMVKIARTREFVVGNVLPFYDFYGE